MKNTIPRSLHVRRVAAVSALLVAALASVAALPGCEIVQVHSDPASAEECSQAAFEAQSIQFCEVQFPPGPEAGQLGAKCSSSADCDSGICEDSFGVCTVSCEDSACPAGYDCGVYGDCYPRQDGYVSESKSECLPRLLGVLDQSCNAECDPARVHGWLDCITAAAPIRDSDDADEKCGIELGQLRTCCPDCFIDSRW